MFETETTINATTTTTEENKFHSFDNELNASNMKIKKIDFSDGDEYSHSLEKGDNVFYVIEGSGVTFYNNKEYYWKKNDIINWNENSETNENIKHYAYNKETILMYISNTNTFSTTNLNVISSTSSGGWC